MLVGTPLCSELVFVCGTYSILMYLVIVRVVNEDRAKSSRLYRKQIRT